MIKRLLSMLFVVMLVAMSICAVPTYAKPDGLTDDVVTDDGNTVDGSDYTAKDMKNTTNRGEMAANLTNMFSPEIWQGANIGRGTEFAAPFVRVIMVLAVAIVTVVCFLFFFVTALDLAYITVPIMRPLLMKGKEGMQDKGGAKFICISDSAIEAVNGGRSGGMGGGGDRGVGSCLTKYISSRTIEFTAFIVFCMLFFTGMLGKVVLAIFNIMYSIINAIMGIAGD